MAITYTYDWSASDDGSVFGGGDIQNIQTDISGQAVDMISVQTISGNKTLSGTTTLSGTVNITGTFQIGGVAVTSTAAELNILDGVTADKDEINKLDGLATTKTELGYVDGVTSAIQTQLDGKAATHNAAYYFEPDSTCVIAFDNGASLLDLSSLHNVPTLTSLADSDLVDGKVSAKCYDFDGANDYVTFADNALHGAMTDITLEAWIYRDTTGNNDTIIWDDGSGIYGVYITDTNIVGQIITDGGAAGTEAFNVAHGLSGSGANQWVYIVVTFTVGGAADIYVNGVDIGNGDSGGNGTTVHNPTNIRIGVDAGESNPFHGKIDGVRILRRNMPVAEILARYNVFA